MIQTCEATIDRLMIIDDNGFDQMMYKRIVDRSDRVRDLIQFTDAGAALDHLADSAQTTPDLILLDINMPRMDGFEFLRAATDRLGADRCPVIVMLTTSLDPSDERRAYSFDLVRGFLHKPLTQEYLIGLARLVQQDRGKA